MKLTRRFFFRAVMAVLVVPAMWASERVAPKQFTEALRARFYPGRIKKLDGKTVSPGKWVG